MVTGKNKSFTPSRFIPDNISESVDGAVLSFSVSEEEISYVLFSSEYSIVLAAERFSLTTSLDEELSFPFPTQSLSSIYITRVHGKQEIIPEGLSGLPILYEDLSLKEDIPALGAHISFGSCAGLEYLKELFPSAIIGHHTTSLIQAVTERNIYQKGIRIYCHRTAGSLDVSVFNGSKLLNHGSELVLTDTDCFYHIISRIEIYKFDQLEDLLYLSGDLKEGGEVYSLLQRYIKNIRLLGGLKYQKVDKSLGLMPKSEFFISINRFQCA